MNIQCINSKLARKLVWPMLIISTQTNNVVTLKSFQSINFECTRMSEAHQDLTSSKFLHWAAWQVAGGTFSSSGHQLLKKIYSSWFTYGEWRWAAPQKRGLCCAEKIWQPGACGAVLPKTEKSTASRDWRIGVQQWMQSKLSGIGVIHLSLHIVQYPWSLIALWVGIYVITRIHLWPMLK
jgi:hypothetical protein